MTTTVRRIRRDQRAPNRPTDALLLEALTAARKLVAAGNERYICWALDRTARRESHLQGASNYLRWFIMKMLRHNGMRHSTVDTYLRARHGSYHNHDPKQIRLDWIDWMKGQLA